MVDALEGVLRIRSVAGDKIKLLIFERDHPPLVVEVVNAHAVGDGKRFVLCKDGRAGIALFLGRVPELKIPREVDRDLLRLQFRLLQAEKIRVKRCKILRKALLHTGAQAVDIPRDEPHVYHSFIRIHVKLYQIMTTVASVNL